MKTKSRAKRVKMNKRKTALLLLAVFVVGIIVGAVITLTQGSRELHRFDTTVAQGVDISSHNGKINWELLSKNTDFAFIRAGYRGYSNGKLLTDKQARRNLRRANELNVPVGLYVYSQAINEREAEEEAELALKVARHYDIGLPIAIDFEYANSKDGSLTGRLFDEGLDKKEATAIINAFCNRIEEAGYTPCVYASSSMFITTIDVKKLSDNCKIWVADYNEKVKYISNYDIWQYTSTGECKGIKSKYVDLNYYYIEK